MTAGTQDTAARRAEIAEQIAALMNELESTGTFVACAEGRLEAAGVRVVRASDGWAVRTKR